MIAEIWRAYQAARAPYEVPPVSPATLKAMRELVATLPIDDLPDLMHSSAESLIRTRNPAVRSAHWCKFLAARERLDAEMRWTR